MIYKGFTGVSRGEGICAPEKVFDGKQCGCNGEVEKVHQVELQQLQANLDRQFRINLILSASCKISRMLATENETRNFTKNTCEILTQTAQCHWALIHPMRHFHSMGKGDLFLEATFSGPEDFQSSICGSLMFQPFLEIFQKAIDGDGLLIVPEATILDYVNPKDKECSNRSVLCLALEYEGRFFGVLAVCFNDDTYPDVETISIFNEITGDLSSALAIKTPQVAPGYFGALFSQTHWPMSIISMDYCFVAVNQAFAALFNFLPDQFTGQPLNFLVDEPKFISIIKSHMERCLADGKPVSHTMVVDFLEGQPWYEFTFFSYSENGIQGVLLHGIEVSEKRRAEQELIENKALLEHVFIDSPISMAVFSCRTNSILYANKAACQDCGVKDPDEVIGKTLFVDEVPFSFFYPDGTPLTIENSPVVKALGGGETRNVEVIIERQDGSRRWGLVSAVPIYNGEGEQTAVLWLSPDITERKEAERKLADTSSLLQNVINQLPIPSILLKAPGGELLNANNAAQEAAGVIDLEEQIGKVITPEKLPFRYFLPGSDTEIAYSELPINKTLRHIETRNQELIVKRSDGTIRHNLANAVPIYNAENELIAGFIAYIDITPIRKMEHEQQQLERQIMQAQKLESIGRLAGGVAHDLNNLLTPILGYSEMSIRYTEVPLNTHIERFVQINSAAEKARDLIRQLLAFSRKQELSFSQVSVNDVLTRFTNLIRGIIPENITIEMVLDPTISLIRADMGQVEQIMMNLSVNASDAMPIGGTLTIETAPARLDMEYASVHNGAVPGDYVMIGFKDTGVGMDEETKLQIFEPFFSTKGELGTGLGLATVYGIVKQHNGNIWVYSEPGQGTLFKVYLPVSSEQAVVEEPIKAASPKLQGDETVLIVEDEPDVLRLAKELLVNYGYHVLTAECGEEALQVASRYGDEIDLLLTDIVMPNMNGNELYSTMKIQIPSIKVLYMSGYTKNILSSHGITDTDAMLIQKPFSILSLAEKVRNCLDT